MKINEIIREKRKELGLTQEQVADRLGVSAPAVNKWEKGISYPDITLLSPLARLLHIDLNTLLSFHETLTDREIALFLNELTETSAKKGFEAAYDMAMEKIRLFPTCDLLILNAALSLEGCLIFQKGRRIKDADDYRARLEELFVRASESTDQNVRSQAQVQRISKYIERKEYTKAQELIDKLPDAVPTDKKQMQVNLYIARENYSDAARISEEKLFSLVNDLHCSLMTLLEIALKEHRDEDADYIADVSKTMAETLDQWEYASYVAHFQLYTARKERIKSLKVLIPMLRSLSKKWNLNDSPLYRHIKTKPVDSTFGSILKRTVLTSIKDDPECDFLKDAPELKELEKESGEEGNEDL